MNENNKETQGAATPAEGTAETTETTANAEIFETAPALETNDAPAGAASDADAADTADTTATGTREPASRRTKVIIAAATAVIVAGIGIGSPIAVNTINHNSAFAGYSGSVTLLTDANSQVKTAEEELAAAQAAALEVSGRARALLTVAAANAGFFEPATAVADLENAIAALEEAAGLVTGENGAVVISNRIAKGAPNMGTDLSKEAATDELNSEAEKITAAAEAREGVAEALGTRIAKITEATKAARTAEAATVAAGEKSGTAWVRPEKTADAAWDAYVAALAAIKADALVEASDLAALTKSYADARTGAQTSHDDTVAAEKAAADQAAAEEAARAAAEEAARQAQGRQSVSGGGSSGGGGGSSWNGGGGNSGGGGGSSWNGGGGNSGGSSGGGSTWNGGGSGGGGGGGGVPGGRVEITPPPGSSNSCAGTTAGICGTPY